MLTLTEFADAGADSTESLTLPFETRQKSRFHARLDSGGEAGVVLPRGMVLSDGDQLTGVDGVVVCIRAAVESTSIVRTGDSLLFARACYHLGNRHVPLQIHSGELLYLQDHVLDDMVRAMGLEVILTRMPFEPENGAYRQSAHGHRHVR